MPRFLSLIGSSQIYCFFVHRIEELLLELVTEVLYFYELLDTQNQICFSPS